MSLDALDPSRELKPAQARKLLSFVLREGEVLFTRHAREELEADEMTEQDVMNALRNGRIAEPAEDIAGSWRYRVHTLSCCVVIAFASTRSSVVVTAWRKR